MILAHLVMLWHEAPGPIHQHFDTSWQLPRVLLLSVMDRSKSVHLEHRTAWFKASVASHVWCWQSTSCSCGLHMLKKWWTINDNRWDIMWCMTCHWCPPNKPSVGINHSKLELITEHLKLPNQRDPTITGINWDALTGFASKRKACRGYDKWSSPWSSWSLLPVIHLFRRNCVSRCDIAAKQPFLVHFTKKNIFQRVRPLNYAISIILKESCDARIPHSPPKGCQV